jgi:hypothetical protein
VPADLAQTLLADLPERWRRTIRVARRAEAVIDPDWQYGDGDVLLAAAWLHDIGYAPDLRDMGYAAELRATGYAADLRDTGYAADPHDTGYAAELRATGYPPLDGAQYLEVTGWPKRVATLVANHSAAWCVAPARGLSEAIARYPREDSPSLTP